MRPFAPICLFLAFAVPCVEAILLFKWLRRRGWTRLPWLGGKWYKRARMVLIAGYAITVVMGLPAVQTHMNDWAISEHVEITKRRAKFPGLLNYHPYVATYVALPVAPCLVLTYHEYQLDFLYGFGGFDTFLWYGWGVRRLVRIPVWWS